MAVLKEMADGYQGMQEVEELRSASGTRILLTDWVTRKEDAPALGDAFPGNERLTLVRRSFNGTGQTGTGSGNDYTHCRVVCEYIDSSATVDGESIITGDYAVDVLTVGEGRTWSDGTTAVEVPLNKILPSYEFTCKRITLATFDSSIISNLGRVNSSSWSLAGRVFPAGTVLFAGAADDMHSDYITGLMTFIQYKFVYRPIPHNYAWRSDTGTYDYTTPLLYESFDFSELGL